RRRTPGRPCPWHHPWDRPWGRRTPGREPGSACSWPRVALLTSILAARRCGELGLTGVALLSLLFGDVSRLFRRRHLRRRAVVIRGRVPPVAVRQRVDREQRTRPHDQIQRDDQQAGIAQDLGGVLGRA